MAKLLKFRLVKRSTPIGARFCESKMFSFVAPHKEAVVSRSTTTAGLRFPNAWLPFVRRSTASR